MSPTSTSRGRSRGKLEAIDIYSHENPDGPDIRPLGKFLNSAFPSVKVSCRPPVHRQTRKGAAEDLAQMLASSRVKDISSAEQRIEPMYGEVDYERRALEGDARVGGIVYDGHRLGQIFADILGRNGGLGTASIVITDRLVSTYSRDDLRHHLRTVVFGFPNIVSIPGIIEAPARPKEYYLLKQQVGELDAERLKSAFKGRFIDYGDDDSISAVLEGLALQCVLFHLTLDPFCEKRGCRFFNAHWQEELIRSQVESKKYCQQHQRLVRELGSSPVIRW